MQALVFDGNLRFVDNYPDPDCDPGEVLVHVTQAGICATDLEIVRGYMEFRGIPGHEFVGIVVDGPAALKGTRVAGEINCVCHRCDMCRRGLEHHCHHRTVLGISGRNGAFAEWLTLPEENLHVIPDGLTHDQAVFIEPLAAAVRITQQYEFEPNDRIAVLGAGRLGLLVAQVLRPRVGELALLARSRAKAAVCKQLGFDLRLSDHDDQQGTFDVVVDCTGQPEGLELAQRLVRPAGTIILKSTYAGNAGPDLALTVINEIRILGSRCGPFAEAIDLLLTGQIRVEPMISAKFPLGDGAEAFQVAQQAENVKILIEMPT